MILQTFIKTGHVTGYTWGIDGSSVFYSKYNKLQSSGALHYFNKYI